jgi:hypothetical protein
MVKMKYSLLLLMIIISSCVKGKDPRFTGSTPANDAVKKFLGIPLKDSIDFIRWQLTINERSYSLHCNYGIGKPNTNGFMGGGKTTEFKGDVKRIKNKYQLVNGRQVLSLLELNSNLLHLLNEDNTMMIGNGGWSYTLNNLVPVVSGELSVSTKQTAIKDSIAFEGRTPCGVPGIIPDGKTCYKLKWWLVLKAGKDPGKGIYYVNGTAWYEKGGINGTWELITTKDGKNIYQLYDENKKTFIRLLKLDEGVVIFIDEKRNLLVGDHDFSYTLNRTSRKF